MHTLNIPPTCPRPLHTLKIYERHMFCSMYIKPRGERAQAFSTEKYTCVLLNLVDTGAESDTTVGELGAHLHDA